MMLHYSSLKQITDDIDDARVYGGIHFRFDQEAGARQGWWIVGYVHRNFLRPAQFWAVRQRRSSAKPSVVKSAAGR